MNKNRIFLFVFSLCFIQTTYAKFSLVTSTTNRISELENSVLNVCLPFIVDFFASQGVVLPVPTSLKPEDLNIEGVESVIILWDRLANNNIDFGMDYAAEETVAHEILTKLKELYYLRFRELIARSQFPSATKTANIQTLLGLYRYNFSSSGPYLPVLKEDLAFFFLDQHIIFETTNDRAERFSLMTDLLDEFKAPFIAAGWSSSNGLSNTEFISYEINGVTKSVTHGEVSDFFELVMDIGMVGCTEPRPTWQKVAIGAAITVGAIVVVRFLWKKGDNFIHRKEIQARRKADQENRDEAQKDVDKRAELKGRVEQQASSAIIGGAKITGVEELRQAAIDFIDSVEDVKDFNKDKFMVALQEELGQVPKTRVAAQSQPAPEPSAQPSQPQYGTIDGGYTDDESAKAQPEPRKSRKTSRRQQRRTEMRDTSHTVNPLLGTEE